VVSRKSMPGYLEVFVFLEKWYITLKIKWSILQKARVLWKEYFENLLETALLCQIFVYWVRDFKLATCLFFNFAELCKVWARLDKVDISHFIRVPSLLVFDSVDLPKIQRGDPYKITNINFAQSCPNFSQFSKIKK
jgi:aminoglycoside/choline kinase family phosphotransferase